MRLLLCAVIIILMGLRCVSPSAADPLPRSVLVLDQSIPHTEFFSEFFSAFRSTLNAGTNAPIAIHTEKLEYSHFGGSEFEQLMNNFID